MKKIIIAIVAVALVAACATGVYFAFFNDKAPSADIEVVPDDFVEGIGYVEAIVKNPERYKTVIGPEYGMDDAKAYYELGTVTLPVSTEFTYTDESDLEAEATVYYPGDFLVEDAGIVYDFTPYNTSIVIEDGVVVARTKIYTP